jgi:hypothetical protein
VAGIAAGVVSGGKIVALDVFRSNGPGPQDDSSMQSDQ